MKLKSYLLGLSLATLLSCGDTHVNIASPEQNNTREATPYASHESPQVTPETPYTSNQPNNTSQEPLTPPQITPTPQPTEGCINNRKPNAVFRSYSSPNILMSDLTELPRIDTNTYFINVLHYLRTDASLSSDHDGEIINYEWRIDGNLFRNGMTLNTVPLGVDNPISFHKVQLTVTDNCFESASSYQRIGFFHYHHDTENWRPLADASEPVPGHEGTTFVRGQDYNFDFAAKNFDIDGDIVSTVWCEGDNCNPLDHLGTAYTSRFVSSGPMKVELTVTDDKGATHTDSEIYNIIEPGEDL